MRVSTSTDYTEVDGDYGPVDGVRVTCDRCGHSTESGGTSDSSVMRCAVLLREECPENEDNFYVT